MGKVSASTGGILKGALIGGAVFKGIDALTNGFRDAAAAVKEQEQLSAQTAAVLKSTGGAAGVTATQVTKLADSIEKKSLLDAEAIQNGQNLLLTFTNIRNEAGKGNDVFNQTTQVMADMATALGSDPKSAAQQLGKALNDPVKGISALSRSGVTFTDQQKKVIARLQETGDTAGAQKVILKELNKEFGGSAEAAGKTAAGQFKHFKDMVDGVFESIVRVAIPILLKLATFLSTNLPKAVDAVRPYLEKMVDLFQAHVQPVLETVFTFLKNNEPVVKAFAVVIGVATVALGAIAIATGVFNAVLAANPIILIVLGLAAMAAALTYAYTRVDGFRKVVDTAFAAIKAVTKAVFPVIKTIILIAFKVIATYVKTYITVVKTVITVAWTVIKAVTKTAWSFIKNGVIDPAKAIYNFVRTTFPKVKSAITGAWDAVKTKTVEAFNAIKTKVEEKLTAVVTLLQGLKGKLQTALSDAGTWLLDVGKKIIDGVIQGIKNSAGLIKDAIQSILPDIPGVDINLPGGLHLRGSSVSGPSVAAIAPTTNIYVTIDAPSGDAAAIGKTVQGYLDAYAGSGGTRIAY